MLAPVMAETLLILCWAPFDWSMQIMLAGVHPLTKYELQPVDVRRSLLAGMPLVLVVVYAKPRVTGLDTNKYVVSPPGVAQ